MSLGASPSFDSMSNFPAGFAQGVQLQGMPILNSYPGRVFWLDSVNGSDGNRGTFQRPFASLSGAQTVMSSPAPTVFGDILMVKAGHRENISSASALSLNLSGMTIVGMGVGNDRPTFTLDTANTATINVTGSSISIQNCRFVANFLAIANLFYLGGATSSTGNASVTASITGYLMTVTASGSGYLYAGSKLVSTTSGFVPGTKILNQLSGTLGGVGVYQVSQTQTVASGTVTSVARDFNVRGCEIIDNSAILDFLNIVRTASVTNANDGLTVFGNTIVQKSAAGVCNLVAPTGTQDRLAVANNFYSSLTTDTGAVFPLTAGKIITNAIICDNVFSLVGATTTTTGILVTTNGSTNSGVICRNFIQSLDATSEILATASSGLIFFENYYSGVADKSGYLLPAADA